MIKRSRYLELVDKDGGVLDLSLGDPFNDSEAIGKDFLLDLIDNSIGASSDFLDVDRVTLRKSKWSLMEPLWLLIKNSFLSKYDLFIQL